MNQLAIPAKTMTSRDIADLAGKRHDHVLRDIEKMLADLGETSPQIWGDLKDAYGRPQRAAFLPKRLTLILVSGYSVAMRAKIIDRWQELEAAAAAPAPALLPDFTDPVAAARAWADQVEAKNLLQIENGHKDAQLAIAGPKVAFANAMLNSEGTVLVRDAAKTIGAPVRKLERALRDKGVILANNAPASLYVTKGYFKGSTVTVPTKTRGEIMRHTARLTTRGMEFLRRFVQRHAGLFSAQGSRA